MRTGAWETRILTTCVTVAGGARYDRFQDEKTESETRYRLASGEPWKKNSIYIFTKLARLGVKTAMASGHSTVQYCTYQEQTRSKHGRAVASAYETYLIRASDTVTESVRR